jgi:competence protein ComEA
MATAVILLLSQPPRGHPIELKPQPSPRPLQVHVAGAVRQPGVYQLPQGAIVEQAVAAAGGARLAASLARLNLAQPVEDGQRIVVPDEQSLTETAGQSLVEAANPPGTGRLSLNEATEPELERLPGIGPSLAKAIVQYRQDHGAFASVEELTNVPGIGPAKLAAVADLLQVP